MNYTLRYAATTSFSILSFVFITISFVIVSSLIFILDNLSGFHSSCFYLHSCLSTCILIYRFFTNFLFSDRLFVSIFFNIQVCSQRPKIILVFCIVFNLTQPLMGLTICLIGLNI
jgi:hypothetical protein